MSTEPVSLVLSLNVPIHRHLIVMNNIFPLRVGRIIIFLGSFVRLSVCLSQVAMTALKLENRLIGYIHGTSSKYQSILNGVQSAKAIYLAFIPFDIFSLELCQ